MSLVRLIYLLNRKRQLEGQIRQSQRKTGCRGYTTDHCKQLQHELSIVKQGIRAIRRSGRQYQPEPRTPYMPQKPVNFPSQPPTPSSGGSGSLTGWIVAGLILLGFGLYYAVSTGHLVIK